MKNNDENIEKLTFNLVKNIGVDEPSKDFTQKVMQSVLLQEKFSSKTNYWWLLLIIPIVMILGWLSIIFLNLQSNINQAISNLFFSFRNAVTVILSCFEGIKLQPVYLMSFIAILLLLSIEETLRRKEIRN